MNRTPFQPEKKTAKQLVGRIGEDAVARHYAAQGYTIVDRNVHILHNEIDLIVRNTTQIIFVEVKTRHSVYGAPSRFGRPAVAVNQAKRQRTAQAAQAYLRTHKDLTAPPLQPRIDVAEVYMRRCADGHDEVTHVTIIPNAFDARGRR